MNLNNHNRRIWLWLCVNGGKWTAREIAVRTGGDSIKIFRALHGMARRELIAKYPPAEGERYQRYAVTGTCLVPLGVCVAEVQA